MHSVCSCLQVGNKMNNEQILKWATFIMSFFAIPAFIWTWNTHERVTIMTIKMETTEKELEKLEGVTTDIQLIQRDIQGINEKLDSLLKTFEKR